MIPGLGGLNPKKMQAMMKQLGMDQEEIPAEEVIIKGNEKTITIKNPSVQKIKMQGTESFQITGDVQEETAAPEITQDDIKLIMEKTNKTEEEARSALEETQDIAEAIMKLSK